jgi:tetratricopeptide (TPR) repeat protein
MPVLTLEQAVQLGLARHQSGDLAGAEEMYRRILAQSPDEPDVINLLGVCLQQQGRSDQAECCFDEAIGRRPTQGAFFTHRGMARLSLGRAVEAVSDFLVGVELDPASPDAHNSLGNGFRAAGNLAAAIAAYTAAIKLRPDFTDAVFNLGLVQSMTGDMAAAVVSFERAVELRPGFSEAVDRLMLTLEAAGRQARQAALTEDAIHFFRRVVDARPTDVPALTELGETLHAADRTEEAIPFFERAAAADPASLAVWNNLGNVLHSAGRISGAVEAYLAALRLVQPGVTPHTAIADVRINLGAALVDARQWDLAQAEFDRALEVPERRGETRNAIGNLLMTQGRVAEAIAEYESAIAERRDDADAMSNLGTALEEQGRRAEAAALYRRAMELKPESISAPWNLALLQLLEGDLAGGFAGYERRWRQKNVRSFRRAFPQPLWSGEELAGRTILLHAEQGFGDAIQFARYVPLVARRGGRVILEVPQQLVRLFRSLDGAAEIVAHGEPLPEFGVHCPLMSLPRVFGTTLETVPDRVPYLSAPADQMSDSSCRKIRSTAVSPVPCDPGTGETPVLQDSHTGSPVAPLTRNRPKVGLVWAGNPNHQRDRQRSIPVSALPPLARTGVQWVGLQISPSDRPPAELDLLDLSTSLTDFADTAAVIARLDLVVTVDTAIAHLAGAMGKPVWVLLAAWPDWRWMLEREDSPWYPTMRLFRQATAGEWGPVIDRVVGELAALGSGPK